MAQILKLTGAAFGVCLMVQGASVAAVNYSTAGSTYSEDFNTLSATGNIADEANDWADDTTIPGWYWADNDGNPREVYFAASGNPIGPGQNNVLSLGAAEPEEGPTQESMDRALGAQSPNETFGTSFIRYGVQLTNSTGSTQDEMSIGFTAEQWRRVSDSVDAQDHLTFDYQVFSAGSGNQINAASGWTAVPALTFDAPQFTGGSSALDGNDAANREVLTADISGIGWDDGEELWLRWSDVAGDGMGGPGKFTRSQMGVDDFSFSAGELAPGLDGDYNNDRKVDAADYTIWRDNLNGDSSVLNGNGTGAATVVPADYDFWKANYGAMTMGAGSLTTAAVPEPSAALLAIMGCLSTVALTIRRSKRP